MFPVGWLGALEGVRSFVQCDIHREEDSGKTCKISGINLGMLFVTICVAEPFMCWLVRMQVSAA